MAIRTAVSENNENSKERDADRGPQKIEAPIVPLFHSYDSTAVISIGSIIRMTIIVLYHSQDCSLRKP